MKILMDLSLVAMMSCIGMYFLVSTGILVQRNFITDSYCDVQPNEVLRLMS